MSTTLQVHARSRESQRVRMLRNVLRFWPFARGRRRAALSLAHMLPTDVLFDVEPGVAMPVELADDVVFWTFAHGSSSWEPVMHVSRALIRPGDTVFDVGANVGMWALGAALRSGPTGRVHAFEPDPAILTRLRRNIQLNKLRHVQTYALAVSDRAGTTAFAPATGSNSGLGALTGARADSSFQVRTTTLDTHCVEHGIGRTRIVKIDVEGAEHLVLRGGSELLSRSDAPVIMLEVDDQLARRLGSSAGEVLRLLYRFGYGVYHVTATTMAPVSVPFADAAGRDLLALKPAHFDEHPILRQMRAVT